MIDKDRFYMEKAMKMAREAYENDEVPISCIIVCEDKIIAKANNQVQLLKDPTAHAEMVAVTAACEHMGSKYLKNCTAYTTLEPCPMCASALHWSQIDRVVYAAKDEKMGYGLFSPNIMPNCDIHHGYFSEESKLLLQEFFRERREKNL